MEVLSQIRTAMNEAVQADEVPSSAPALETVKVAHSIEEMMQAFAVRASVFMAEQDCPYAEEFDGNDFTATHILGLIGEEPVATMRIRYFASFARLERMAVKRLYRNRTVASGIIEFAFELCREKGYRKLHGHAEEYLIPFWQKYGFRPMNAPNFDYSGREYLEIECDLEAHPDPVTIDKDPLVIIRPEGAWDKPGPVERLTANPAAERTGDDRDGDAWTNESRIDLKRLG